jgi:hypothetical protein
MRPSVIATLATGVVKSDLQLFLFSLGLWNKELPTVYILCDSAIEKAVHEMGYKGRIVTKVALDKYAGLTRAEMEKKPGIYGSLFFDLCVEKTAVMKWVFETEPVDVLYCDCDICFMGPLFSIPEGADVAVSHHEIRPQDEARYGKYNGGILWAKDVGSVNTWIDACKTSRFVDQAAIEDMAAAAKSLYQIPRTENYGWWRLWQGVKPANQLMSEWSMKEAKNCGIMINGQPLGSIHTHFGETRDAATVQYNKWVLHWLTKLTTNSKAQRLLGFIHSLHPWMILD